VIQYIFESVNMCTRVRGLMCVCVWICQSVYLHAFLCVCIYVCARPRARLLVRACLFVFVCLCLCVCVCVCVLVFVCVYACFGVCVYVCTIRKCTIKTTLCLRSDFDKTQKVMNELYQNGRENSFSFVFARGLRCGFGALKSTPNALASTNSIQWS